MARSEILYRAETWGTESSFVNVVAEIAAETIRKVLQFNKDLLFLITQKPLKISYGAFFTICSKETNRWNTIYKKMRFCA